MIRILSLIERIPRKTLVPFHGVSVKKLIETFRETWSAALFEELVQGIIDLDNLPLFKLVAPKDLKKLEKHLKQAITSPTFVNPPLRILQYAFSLNLSLELGSVFVTTAIMKEWMPLLQFFDRHPEYHNGVSGHYFVDILLHPDRQTVPLETRRALLKSEYILKDLPRSTVVILLSSFAIQGDSEAFGLVMTNPEATSGLRFADFLTVYSAIHKNTLNGHKQVQVLTDYYLLHHSELGITGFGWYLLFSEAMEHKNYDVVVALLVSDASRLSERVLMESMDFYKRS